METAVKRRALSRGPAIPGIVTLVGLGTISAIVCGVLYAAALNYNPLKISNFILTLLCGYAAGRAIQFAARTGGVSNRGVVGVVALALGVLAVYVSWVAFIAIRTQIEYYHPSDMFEVIRTWGINGLWEINGETPTGLPLHILWSLEAAVIIALSVVFGVRTARPAESDSGAATAKVDTPPEAAQESAGEENA